MIGADQPQVIGAPALHEAQIARVIDDAGEVCVLVIDAHRLTMFAVPDDAIEGARIVSRRCARVHRSSRSLAKSHTHESRPDLPHRRSGGSRSPGAPDPEAWPGRGADQGACD